ncbi:MAG: Asp-tRNA(Asn)/Glu-tRNA(Gln) amidotransferase subunit GatC [Chlamydiia bacterium]
MSVSPENLQLLAKLCRVGLVEGEEQRLLEDLNRILVYVDQLNEVDISQVEPLLQVLDGLCCPMAEDVVDEHDALPRARFLENAPAGGQCAGMIRVPPVMSGYES